MDLRIEFRWRAGGVLGRPLRPPAARQRTRWRRSRRCTTRSSANSAAIVRTAFSTRTISVSARVSRARATRGLMERYLAMPEADGPAPSAEFDQAWYVAQNPDWRRTHPHPFLHFLEAGLAGRQASAGGHRRCVSARRRSAASVARSRKRPFACSTAGAAEGEFKPPLNRQEMRARQDRFFAAGRLRIERESKPTGRRRLVYVQSGKRLRRQLFSPSRGITTCCSTTMTNPRPIRRRKRSSFSAAARTLRSAGCLNSGRTSCFV